jgi:iron(III) transport system permease protein
VSADAPSLALADDRAPRLGGGRTYLPIAATLALVGALVLTPLAYLAWRTFFDGGALTTRFVREAYAADGLLEMSANSLIFAGGSTLVALLAGVPLGWLLVRTDLPLRRTFLVLALFPLVVPGVLYTIAWIFLGSPNAGLINTAVGRQVVDIFGLPGMIVVQGFHLTPLVLLLTAAAVRSLDGALEDAALAAGASLGTVLRRITLPLLRPAVLAGTLVSLIRALESFEVPALLGIPGGTWVFTSRIFSALGRFPDGVALAGAYALPLLALTCTGALVLASLTRRQRAYETVGGRTGGRRPLPLGAWRLPLAAGVAAYLLVSVVLPAVTLLWISTQPYVDVPSRESFGRMSLDGYAAVLGSPATLRAFRHSLVLGAAAATATVVIGAVVAWFAVRSGVRGRRLADAIGFLPVALPGIVLGAALLAFWVRAPWTVYGTLWILLIAYVTRFLPYGLRAASAAMAQLGRDLEEAAQVAGASWAQAFRRVLLPLAGPGLLAGWIMVVVFAMRELSASIVLYGPRREVVAVRIWQHYENGDFRAVGALGVVLTLASLALVGAATLLFRHVSGRVSRARG